MNDRHDTIRLDPRFRGGFTLLELLLACAILAVAIALVISAFARSASFVRDRATELQLRSLDVAVQQFEKDYGFLPPLVDPGNNSPVPGPARLADYDRTIDENYAGYQFDSVAPYPNPPRDISPRGRLRVPGYAEFDGGDEEAINKYLRNESFADNDGLYPRYSFLSLGSYLLGTLPAAVDGGAGSLMGRPTPDGRFDESREKRPPAMDSSSLSDNRLVRRRSFSTAAVPAVAPLDATMSVIVDRNLVSVRYYRWEPLYHVPAGAPVATGREDAPANDPARAGLVRDENVPYVLGFSKSVTVNGGPLDDSNSNTSAARQELRKSRPYQTLATQRYAISTAGPDTKFGGGSNRFNAVNGVRDTRDNLVISAGNLVSPEDMR